MKLEQSHKLSVIVVIVVVVIISLIILLLPTKPVTGSIQFTPDSLMVIQSDGQSIGQSIQGIELVPAPTNDNLQSSGDGMSLQPTGEVK